MNRKQQISTYCSTSSAILSVSGLTPSWGSVSYLQAVPCPEGDASKLLKNVILLNMLKTRMRQHINYY